MAPKSSVVNGSPLANKRGFRDAFAAWESGKESKRRRFDSEDEGARAATDYAVKAIYATPSITKAKREYLKTVKQEHQSGIVWTQMLPGFKLFLDNEEWSYDDLQKLASTPSDDLASFQKAGVYVLIARDPVTGECIIYVGSTGCLLTRYESHITEVMKGLAGKHYAPKKFYNWCVEHEVIPECVIAMFDDTEDNEPHFNEFAEACIMSMLGAFTDETCHYGGQAIHAKAARSEELPESIPWEGGNACWPVMMGHSTSWPGAQDFEQKKCRNCDFTCYKEPTMAAHMLHKHRELRYPCSFCDLAFSSAADAREHGAEMHPRAYQCPNHECGRVFARQGQLNDHIKSHTRPYSCEICGKCYGHMHELRVHMQRHTDKLETQKPHKCRVAGCDNRYTRAQHRDRHEQDCGKTLGERKTFKCSKCPRGFTQQEHLARHEKDCGKTLEERKTFVCSICNNGFTDRDTCVRHEKDCGKPIEERRTFKCSKCPASFVSKKDLTRHEQTCGKAKDEKEKPFKCSVCNKGFTEKSNCMMHEKYCGKADDEKKRFKCSICNEGFSSKAYRDKHEPLCGKPAAKKEVAFTCSKCGTEFLASASAKSNFKRHENLCGKTKEEKEKQKRFKCSKCGNAYGSKTKLNDHERNCGKAKKDKERPFKCSTCGKGFFTKDDLNKHVKFCGVPQAEREKPFKCGKCGKGFDRKDNCKAHEKKCTG